MSVKFKCNQSGNVFEYFTEHDIKTMRAHTEYTEVKKQQEVLETPAVKKAGRPRKEAVEGAEDGN